MNQPLSVYMTTSSRSEADSIAHALVEEGLAACVNILPEITSHYRWQGKVETAGEIALLAKTTQDRYAALEKRVKELHSYDCPCILAWPIVAGNPDYLSWLQGCVP